MSKRYSGKSFKDSSVKKKPKLSFKEKRKLKKDKQKNQNIIKFFTKKNLALIESKESYIFKKFKYKKLSKN